MKAYKVTVNGNVYEITLEVIDKADIKAALSEFVATYSPADDQNVWFEKVKAVTEKLGKELTEADQKSLIDSFIDELGE